jgi:hypothetical protein
MLVDGPGRLEDGEESVLLARMEVPVGRGAV